MHKLSIGSFARLSSLSGPSADKPESGRSIRFGVDHLVGKVQRQVRSYQTRKLSQEINRQAKEAPAPHDARLDEKTMRKLMVGDIDVHAPSLTSAVAKSRDARAVDLLLRRHARPEDLWRAGATPVDLAQNEAGREWLGVRIEPHHVLQLAAGRSPFASDGSSHLPAPLLDGPLGDRKLIDAGPAARLPDRARPALMQPVSNPSPRSSISSGSVYSVDSLRPDNRSHLSLVTVASSTLSGTPQHVSASGSHSMLSADEQAIAAEYAAYRQIWGGTDQPERTATRRSSSTQATSNLAWEQRPFSREYLNADAVDHQLGLAFPDRSERSTTWGSQASSTAVASSTHASTLKSETSSTYSKRSDELEADIYALLGLGDEPGRASESVVTPAELHAPKPVRIARPAFGMDQGPQPAFDLFPASS